MALEKYKEKRSFDKTPEPQGVEELRGSGLPTFCVQRHHATRLHYDLRLEVDGVLKSWAVPKGPTLDPGEKRLAMMVEDHPLDYGGFEGIIPKGNYGGGSVMLWDRGTYELLGTLSAEEQLKKGDFKFRLHGAKLNGEFAIVRMKTSKGNEWLLLKKKDAPAQAGWNTEEHALSVLTGRTQEEIAKGLSRQLPEPKAIEFPKGARKAAMPTGVTPMLAEIGRGLPASGERWMYEVKWDGVRALCYIREGRMQMVSRNRNLMDFQYPELSILPHHVKAREAILDAEIAMLDARGVPSFEALQRRINVADAGSVAALARSSPVVMYVFDLLYADGHDLRGVRLDDRKKVLREILDTSDTIRYSEDFGSNGPALLEAVKAQGIEGIVGKLRSSFYESRRTSDWIKYKVHSSDSFILCGFLKGEREYFGALVLGVYDGSKLKWTGNVGTGFDVKMMQLIHEKLAPLATEKCPLAPERLLPKKDVTWVRPELVAEIRYTNITSDGKLRAPVFIGLRPDVDAAECVRGVEGSGSRERERAGSGSGADDDGTTPLLDSRGSRDRASAEEEIGTNADLQAGLPAPHRKKPGSRERERAESGSGADDGGTTPLLDSRGSRDRGSQNDPPSSEWKPLLDASQAEAMLTIDGHRLKFTNLNKVYFPAEKYTKRDLLNYYDAVAPLLVPHLKDRPLSLKRYPNGIAADFFFQKEVAESFPQWLRTEIVDGVRYVIGNDRATLLFLVNLGCIDHNPGMSRVQSIENPDYVLIDLDPYECGFEKIVEAALLVRKKLDLAELEGYPKTTGGDGMHIIVPLEPRYSYEQVRSFAQLLAELVIQEKPGLFTTPRAVSKREKGRVYFDWAQIGSGKTISAPYVVRAHAGAPVATPLAWEDVSPKLHPGQFTIANAMARFDRVGELFDGVLNKPQELDGAVEKLAAKLR